MKNLFKNRLVLIGLLLLTAATVTASEPVIKPDTATKSTSARIVPVAGGAWNYTNAQLFAAATSAIPTHTFSFVEFQNPSAGVYWLHLFGVNSTGMGANVYFYLNLNGGWYELSENGVPNSGGAGAYSCSGWCEDGHDTNPQTCVNSSSTLMVRCDCQGGGSEPMGTGSYCSFHQYPIIVSETMHNALKQIHD